MKRITMTHGEYTAITEWFDTLGDYSEEWHFNHRWGEGSLERAANALFDLTDYGTNLTFTVEDDVLADMIEDLYGMADEAGFQAEDYEEND